MRLAHRRLLGLLVVLAAWLGPLLMPVSTQTAVVTGAFLQPVGHAMIICLSTQDCTLAALTATLLNPANAGPIKVCEITTETNSVRFWKDGTSPATTPLGGHLVASAGTITLTGYTAALQFKARAATTPAVLQVTCSR